MTEHVLTLYDTGIIHLPNIVMILMLYDTDIENWECQPSMHVSTFFHCHDIDICSIQLMLHDTDIDGYMILKTW